MFWLVIRKGKREIIETVGGIPPPDQDLTILGGFITREEAERKMNEDQHRPTPQWR